MFELKFAQSFAVFEYKKSKFLAVFTLLRLFNYMTFYVLLCHHDSVFMFITERG